MRKSKTKDFNYPKKLETQYASADLWDEFEIIPDDMESIKFYISDAGEVVVEFIACDYDVRTTKYKNVHISLSELKGIIAEVEQMASVTFDEEGGQGKKEVVQDKAKRHSGPSRV